MDHDATWTTLSTRASSSAFYSKQEMMMSHWWTGIGDTYVCKRRGNDHVGPLIEEAMLLTCPECQTFTKDLLKRSIDTLKRSKAARDKIAYWKEILEQMEEI